MGRKLGVQGAQIVVQGMRIEELREERDALYSQLEHAARERAAVAQVAAERDAARAELARVRFKRERHVRRFKIRLRDV